MRALFFLFLLVGCVSAPALEPEERYQVSCRRGTNAGECIIRVQALFGPPPPIGQCPIAAVTLVEGRVELEMHGWGSPRFQGQEERVVEAKVGFRPDVPFTFALLDRGHRDEYTIVIPAAGDPRIEPRAGEFSERG